MKTDLIKIDELRELLPDKPSRQTVHRWCCQGKIPFYKYGRNNYFSKSEILKWNENGRVYNKTT